MNDRLAELRELQDEITATRRDDADRHACCGCWSTRPGVARSHARRPRSTASCTSRHDVPVGEFVEVEIVDALGPDLVAAGGLGGR